MENFTNETINTAALPRFEEVQLTALHPKYWFVLLVNCIISVIILGCIVAVLLYKSEKTASFASYVIFIYSIVSILIFIFQYIGYKKKAFAFRNHDVIFRSGIIATNTMIIPYNRVQHVALHEGFISRYFGLAKVEIFTAGGNASDVEIPGLDRTEAENIKQLLMGKIQKQL